MTTNFVSIEYAKRRAFLLVFNVPEQRKTGLKTTSESIPHFSKNIDKICIFSHFQRAQT